MEEKHAAAGKNQLRAGEQSCFNIERLSKKTHSMSTYVTTVTLKLH